jgi:hypothetical protein
MTLACTTTPGGRRGACHAPHAAGSHMGRAPKLRSASSASVNAAPVFTVVALDMSDVGTDCKLAPPPHKADCSLTLLVLVSLGHGEEGEGSEDDEKEDGEKEEREQGEKEDPGDEGGGDEDGAERVYAKVPARVGAASAAGEGELARIEAEKEAEEEGEDEEEEE